MRAIQKLERAPGLTLTDIPKPNCGLTDVVIQVHHAGVCGTDLHIADWDEWAQSRIKPPIVVGHEFAGEIIEIGQDVGDAFHIGQRVTAEGHIVSGHTKQSRTGQGHVCPSTRIIGVDRDGAFAEFIAMPASNVMPLGDISTVMGAIMDPVGNAFHTVLTAEIPGSTVLILGCGPIGCFAVDTLLASLVLFLRRTPLGVAMRAASEDFLMARLLGVRANLVIAAAFAISGFLAAVVSLLYVTQTGVLSFHMGIPLVLFAFVATVVGGMGSLTGAVLGGFVVGVASVVFQVVLPIDMRPNRDAWVYAMILVILLLRPSGLVKVKSIEEKV